MKKKTIAGLIAIVAIVVVAMFAGCVEEEATGALLRERERRRREAKEKPG